MKTIPKNYRKLKSNETLRKGDLYYYKVPDRIIRMSHNSNNHVSDFPQHHFFRRSHVKVSVKANVVIQPKKNVPIVYFGYNGKTRRVQIISCDKNYLKGLEMTWNGEKYKYQFKSYLTRNISDTVQLDSYQPTR